MTDRHEVSTAFRRRALLVEDEILIAMHTEDMLLELDIDVIETASNLASAVNFAKFAIFDFAVLDINLAGDQSYPVAGILRERGIPYIFVSGYGSLGMPEDYRFDIQIQKPFRVLDLKNAIDDLFAN